MTENAQAQAPDVDVRIADVTKWPAPAPASVENATGVMRTARASHGGTLAKEPTGDDIVTVNGVQMPLSTAAKHGFVKQDGDGRYTDLNSTDQTALTKTAADRPSDQTSDDSNMLSYTPAQEEAIAGVAELVSSAGANPVNLVGEFMSNPDQLPQTLIHAARARSVSEAEAQAEFEKAVAGVREALDVHVIGAGVSEEQLDAFWEYVDRAVPPASLAHMITQAAFMGDASQFNKLAANFRVAHGSGRGAAQNVEMRQRGYAGQGDISTVRVRGVGPVSLEAARRLKIV